MRNFYNLIEEKYNFYKSWNDYDSKLEFIGMVIFDFNTYDGELDILFTKKMLQTIKYILKKETLNNKDYEDNIIMVNMCFLRDKLEYGTSIRLPWFLDEPCEIDDIKLEKGELTIFLIELLKWCENE